MRGIKKLFFGRYIPEPGERWILRGYKSELKNPFERPDYHLHIVTIKDVERGWVLYSRGSNLNRESMEISVFNFVYKKIKGKKWQDIQK